MQCMFRNVNLCILIVWFCLKGVVFPPKTHSNKSEADVNRLLKFSLPSFFASYFLQSLSFPSLLLSPLFLSLESVGVSQCQTVVEREGESAADSRLLVFLPAVRHTHTHTQSQRGQCVWATGGGKRMAALPP